MIRESSNVVVSGNTFSSSGGTSGGLQISENSSNVQVTNNNFTVPSNALGVYRAGTGVSVTGNTFSGGSNNELFQLRSDSPTTVSGNTFNSIASNERGLAIYPDSGTGSEQVGGHTISGNTFSGSGSGIIFFNSGSNTVTGNTFSGLSHAIDFGTCCGGSLTNSNTFSGNTFSGNTYDYYPSEPEAGPEGDTTPPTVTATAYLNSTSPTGRTLSLVGDELPTSFGAYDKFIIGILKDGSILMTSNFYFNQPTMYLPIPEDWETGTYDIIWYNYQGPGWMVDSDVDSYINHGFLFYGSGDSACYGIADCGGGTISSSSSTAVTIPTLTSNTTPPTMIATAYLNGTSPTGRTLAITSEPDSPHEQFVFTIYKDGTAVTPVINWTFSNVYVGLPGEWQIPIPADWLAGTYDITWDHDYTGQPADSSGSETVVIPALADTTPPIITGPSDQTCTAGTYRDLDCVFTTTDPAGYVYNFQVTATDDVAIDTTGMSNGGPGIFCVRGGMAIPTSPGWLFPVDGTDGNPYTMIICSVQDTAGNSAQVGFDVTVNYVPPADTTIPTVTASAYLNATSPTGRTLKLTASDWTSDISSLQPSIIMPDGSFFQHFTQRTLMDTSGLSDLSCGLAPPHSYTCAPYGSYSFIFTDLENITFNFWFDGTVTTGGVVSAAGSSGIVTDVVVMVVGTPPRTGYSPHIMGI